MNRGGVEVTRKLEIGTKVPKEFIFNNMVWFLLAAVLITMGIFEPMFFSVQVLKNILIQASVMGVLTAGLSLTILLGEIDLSIVGILGFSAGVGTLAMNKGLPWFLAIIVILTVGFVFGSLNGLMIAKLKAVSLIQTLAVLITLQGGLLALTKGTSIVNFHESFKWVGQGSIISIPVLPVVFLLVYFGINVLLTRTPLGRSMYAVGGNARCAHVSGIKVDNIIVYVYMMSGFLSGLAGFLLSSYMGAVTPSFGAQYLNYCLAAAVIGGISLKGGRGNIKGVLGGVLLLTVIQVGLQVLGISSYYVTMVGGLMILVAVVIDALRLKYAS